MSKINRIFMALLVIVVGIALSACALTPADPQVKLHSDELLSARLEAIETYLRKAPPDRRTVIYLGSAQHSQSLAFERDVLLMKQRLEEINPDVQSIILSNQLELRSLTYPFATGINLNKALRKINSWSTKYPVNLVFLISTHGAANNLAVNINNTYQRSIDSHDMSIWLSELNSVPTALFISACYSGSFIPPLQGPQRVIMTASAHNRNSFGCAYSEPNTYFIGNLLDNGWNPRATWHENYDRMAKQILAIEQKKGLLPSLPQIYLSDEFKHGKIDQFVRGLPTD